MDMKPSHLRKKSSLPTPIWNHHGGTTNGDTSNISNADKKSQECRRRTSEPLLVRSKSTLCNGQYGSSSARTDYVRRNILSCSGTNGNVYLTPLQRNKILIKQLRVQLKKKEKECILKDAEIHRLRKHKETCSLPDDINVPIPPAISEVSSTVCSSDEFELLEQYFASQQGNNKLENLSIIEDKIANWVLDPEVVKTQRKSHVSSARSTTGSQTEPEFSQNFLTNVESQTSAVERATSSSQTTPSVSCKPKTHDKKIQHGTKCKSCEDYKSQLKDRRHSEPPKLIETRDSTTQLDSTTAKKDAETNSGNLSSVETESEEDTSMDFNIKFKFLKKAFLYFLTDKDNCDSHLKVIQEILGYSTFEKNAMKSHL